MTNLTFPLPFDVFDAPAFSLSSERGTVGRAHSLLGLVRLIERQLRAQEEDGQFGRPTFALLPGGGVSLTTVRGERYVIRQASPFR